MLLRWGLEKADKLGLVVVVDAVPASLTYYKRFGFVNEGVMDPAMAVETPSEEWKRLEKIDKHLYWVVRQPERSD